MQLIASPKFVLIVQQFLVGTDLLARTETLPPSGISYGWTVAAPPRAFCFKLRNVLKSVINMKFADLRDNVNTSNPSQLVKHFLSQGIETSGERLRKCSTLPNVIQ